MNFEELLSKDLGDASMVVRQMTSDEIDQFQAAVMKMDSVFRCHYARLLVCRNDSIRLLSLLDQGDLELTHCCIRYLKIRSVRKDLLSKLTSESEFCKLYSASCDYGRNALLETLVWNKNREENCLADRLLLSGALQLNAYQNRLLRSACSSSHFIEMQQSNNYSKKYMRQQKTELDQNAVEHLYHLYQNRNEFMDDLTEKCDVYIPFIKDIWRTAEVDGKQFRVFDLILDLWACQNKSVNYLSRVLTPNTDTLRIDALDNTRNFIKMKYTCTTLKSCVCFLFSVATVYCCKKCELAERVKFSSNDDYSMSVEKILFIYQSALVVGDEELINLTLKLLTMEDNIPTYYGFGINSAFPRIKRTLTSKHYSIYLEGLQDYILNKMRCISPSYDIYWSHLPSTIYVLSKEVSNSPKMEEILNLFFTFEKRYLTTDISTLCSFYGLQNQEVPLDFAYQLAPKTLSTDYPTCRKWESILCLKGNTYLNSREASQRMTVLKSLLKFGSDSHDVRAFYRCFAVYARTEMKFNDITMDLSDSLSYFSPDTLGLSPLSISFSGSAEEAEKARCALVSMILEWANFKKGDAMISPLITIVGNMYYNACIYPEYEDIYTSMMKPLCEFMVKDSMMYERALLTLPSRKNERALFYKDAYCKENRLSSLLSAKGIKNYQTVEAYCAGKKESLSFVDKVYHCYCTLTCTFPKPDIKSAPIAKKPLLMVLELAKNDNVNMNLVCGLFDAFVNSAIIDDKYTSSVDEVVSRYEEDKMELVRRETTLTTSGDRELLNDLYDDASLSWKFSIKGYTMMMTLHRLYHFECGKYFTRSSSKRTSLELVSIPEKMDIKENNRLSSDRSLRRHLLHENPAFIAMLMNEKIDSLNKGYNILLNVKDLDITVDSLTALLNTSVPVYDVFTLFGIKSRMEEIPSLLKILSDSSLKELQKLASLSTYVSFQSAVTAVSLNKSDKPLMDKTLIDKLPSLHIALVNACQILVSINKECQYRGISDSQVFNVFTICPFLVDWLKAVKEFKTQDFFTMKKEDSVELETSPRCSVELDFSHNVVVCRLVEILIYSRTIKEFFGNSVFGFGLMSTMLTTEFALLMCRRYLLVSSFVHIAESIIEHLLLTASNSNEVTSGILSMIADSSSCITVALIGLLFRLGAKPVIQTKGDMMKSVIIKVTNYIIKNDFKSEDVYVFILKWICRQVLEVENYDKDLVRELLQKLTMLNVTEAAGKTVFGIMGVVAAMEVDYAVGHTDVARKALKDIESWYDHADDRKKNLVSLFLEMISLFNTEDNESIFIQQAGILLSNKYAGEYPELLNYCRGVLNAMYKPYDDTSRMFKSALCLLMLNKCDDAIELGNHAVFVIRQLKQLKMKYEDLTVSSEYASIGIPESMNGMIKEIRFDYDLLYSLYEAEDVCLKCLSSLTVSYPDGIVASAFASCLLQSVGQKEFSKKDIDLDKLCDAVETTFKPWMYGFIKGDQFDRLFYADREFKERIQSLIERRKTRGSVFLTLRYGTWDDCVNNCAKMWVSDNGVEELYSYL